MGCEWSDKIFSSSGSFEALTMEIFHYQYMHNDLYRSYVNILGIEPADINSVTQIPFLPVGFFKTHQVKSGVFEPAVVFESSGTTNTGNSRHFVKDVSLYESSFTNGFKIFYGDPAGWCILALLPSYLERKNASLVYMAEKLIEKSGHPCSGFYLNEFEELYALLTEMEKQKQKTLLLGTTFALLDFSERKPLPLRHTIIMETGGMKGRREEMTREEVHVRLKKAFGAAKIHSEYGMTELLSQAYSLSGGRFSTPPWMKVFVRDEEDPLALYVQSNTTGAINIIDLANVHSCAFIATDDVGMIHPDGSFEVLGRMDGSDLRGCSLMTL